MNELEKLIKISKNDGSNNFLEFFKLNKKLVFFGAENNAEHILNIYNSKLWWAQSCQDVVCIVDNNQNRVGTIFHGKPVVSFSEFINHKNEFKVVITGFQYYKIMQQLKDHDFFDVLDYYYDPTNRTGNTIFFALTFTEHIKKLHYATYEDKHKLIKAFGLFSDEMSKNVFISIIQYRIDLNLAHIRKISKNNNFYFDENFIKFKGNEVFFDVGACIGDSIVDFQMHTNGNYNYIYAFEADKNTFLKLKLRTNYFLNNKNIKLVNFAICNSNETVKYNSSRSLGVSNLSDDGDSKVTGITLDEFYKKLVLKENENIFIKMDIEGAEIDAIEGARNLIQMKKPNLIISVYHKPEDIWRIPLILKEMNPEYKFYLRHQSSYDVTETICYAIMD